MMNLPCEFCTEINKSEDSVFHHLYSEIIPNRIILENQYFVCLPTIGQLINGSLLILPKEHLFTLASMSISQADAFKELLAEARGLFDTSIVFEHGCWPKEGHNCGIYHAHAHIVPIPDTFEPNQLLPNSIPESDIDSCLKKLNNVTEYALYIDSNNKPFYLLPNGNNIEIFKSQYFRRWLSASFKPDKEFDWNKYVNTQEAELIDIVKKFQSKEIHAYTV